MFLNLYCASKEFRNYNWTDFLGRLEKVEEDYLRDHLERSYRPGKDYGEFEPYFDAVLYFTLRPACAAGFLRTNSLPAVPRDYLLSKLFQFIHLPIEARYETDTWKVQSEIEEFLDSIPSSQLDKLCQVENFNWYRFYDSTLGNDLKAVMDQLPSAFPEVRAKQPRERKVGKVAPFPTPPGANWSDVWIEFISDERLQIHVRNTTETRNYAEFGFVDSRTGKPDLSWNLLRQFAEHHGTISTPTQAGAKWVQVEPRVAVIRRRLRSVFGLDSDPFAPFKNVKCYRARFRIKTARSFDH